MAAKLFTSLGALLSVVLVVNAQGAFDQQLYEDVLDPEQCSKQLHFLGTDRLRWQFIDASGKIPSGILSGNMVDMGDYFQCLAINKITDQFSIQGKYCMIQTPLNQNPIQTPDLPDLPEIPEFPRPPIVNETDFEAYNQIKSYVHQITGLGYPVDTRIFPVLATGILRMTLAVCIPKVCTVEETIDFVVHRYPYINISYTSSFCRLSNDKPFVAADYTAIAIFSVIGLLVVLSTSYDLYQTFYVKSGCSRVSRLCTSFSIYTNTQRFLTFKSSPGALECVDGIRAISMLWVVVGHTYCMTLLGYIHNLDYTLKWMSKLTSVWITSAPIVVDTFFLLSGILVVYATVGKINRGKFIRSLPLFYLHRLLRIFPLLATMVLLQASLLNHVSDGPLWQNVAHATENCRNHWWSALLHVQNYVNPLTMCLAQSWYLSVDTQLYIICPLVLIFLFGRERTAWGVLSVFLLLALLSSSLYSFLNNFSAALGNPSRLYEFSDYIQYYYFNTLTRAPPFFVGMIYGYMLYLCKDTQIRISRVNVIFLWLLSFAMMAFCIFTIHPVMQADHDTQFFDNFLNAYMRAIWAFAVGWLILACHQGYGGPINWFLSLPLWKLPARMSFAMYLFHLPIIMLVNGSWVKTFYFSDSINIYKFLGDISITFIFSFILCITIDAPFSTLQKLLMNGANKRPRKPITPLPMTTEDNGNLKTAL